MNFSISNEDPTKLSSKHFQIEYSRDLKPHDSIFERKVRESRPSNSREPKRANISLVDQKLLIQCLLRLQNIYLQRTLPQLRVKWNTCLPFFIRKTNTKTLRSQQNKQSGKPQTAAKSYVVVLCVIISFIFLILYFFVLSKHKEESVSV